MLIRRDCLALALILFSEGTHPIGEGACRKNAHTDIQPMCNKNKSDICDFWMRCISACKSIVYMNFRGGGKFFCKTHFFEKNLPNIWSFQKKAVPLHPISLARVRASCDIIGCDCPLGRSKGLVF